MGRLHGGMGAWGNEANKLRLHGGMGVEVVQG